MPPRHSEPGRPRRWSALVLALGVVVLLGLASLDVTTKQGVNFEVSTHRIPLYLKALQFLERSAQYRQIAEEVVDDATSDSERTLKIFEWTRRSIRPTPPGWPIVDDHILNIIIRGHGMGDQHADVFATLATYGGVPAFWAKLPESARAGLILSFARIDGRWRVFDVFNGVVFRTADGDLATMDDLKGHEDLVPAAVRSLDIAGLRYADIVTTAPMPPVPEPLRAELQMPLARLRHEVGRALRIGQ